MTRLSPQSPSRRRRIDWAYWLTVAATVAVIVALGAIAARIPIPIPP